MSILIKGMKMPQEQSLRMVLNPNGKLFVDHGAYFDEYEVVEVPTPHGRLVDIEAVYREVTSYYKQRTELQHIALRECLGRVPTIIEAEGGKTDVNTD